MLHIAPSPALKQRSPQAMSIDPESVRLSPFSATYHPPIDGYAAHVLHPTPGSCIARIALQECSPSATRRPYICPPLWVNCTPVPQHWDISSGDNHLDIDEEDGYVLSANGEGSTCGAFVACEPLTAVRRARPGRLRIKPWILHRRRISPTATTVSFLQSPLLSPATDQSSQPIDYFSAFLRFPHLRSPPSDSRDAQHGLQEPVQQPPSTRCTPSPHRKGSASRGATRLTAHLTFPFTCGVAHVISFAPAATRALRADEFARGDERPAPYASAILPLSQRFPVPALWAAA